MTETDGPQTVELETIVGLHGCITRWRCLEPADGTLLYPRHGDAFVALAFPECAVVEAVFLSEVEQPVRLEVNGFSGWSCSLNGVPMDWQATCSEWGNAFLGTLRRGESRLVVTVEPQQGSRLLGARLMKPDRGPLTGVQQVFLSPASGLSQQLRRGLSPLGDFLRLANQPCALEFAPGMSWKVWRSAVRAKLDDLLRVPVASEPPEDRLIGLWEEEGYRRERHLLLFPDDGTRVPLWLLVPTRSHGAGLLCLHGHGYTLGETVGVTGESCETIRSCNYDYARQAAQRGFVAVTPDFRGFGDRDDHAGGSRDACDAYYLRLTQYGQNVVSLQLHDLRAVTTYLASRPEVDPARLGCLGLSYGGRMTMYAAATDERIRAAVVSGALNCLKERLLRNRSCGAQLVPGLLEYADVPEILGLIAPRPLFLELGCRDDTSPELFASEIYHKLAGIYAAAGADDQLDLDIFEAGHRFHGGPCWSWLDGHLNP
jgi:hypothetical protein